MREREQPPSGDDRAPREAVVVCDRVGLIVMWDPAAARLLGWSSSEVVERPIAMLLPVEARRTWGSRVAAALSAGHVDSTGSRIRTEVIHRDGHLVPVEVGLTLLRGERHGQVVGVAGSIRGLGGPAMELQVKPAGRWRGWRRSRS